MKLVSGTYDLNDGPQGDLTDILDTVSNFQANSVFDGWGISCEIALRWLSLDLIDGKSTLVQFDSSNDTVSSGNKP